MRVLMCWKVRWRPVTDWPYIRAFQMTVPEIIITGPHCLCVQCVAVSNTCVETCVSARYRTISRQCDIAKLTNPRSISRYRIIDINPIDDLIYLRNLLFTNMKYGKNPKISRISVNYSSTWHMFSEAAGYLGSVGLQLAHVCACVTGFQHVQCTDSVIMPTLFSVHLFSVFSPFIY